MMWPISVAGVYVCLSAKASERSRKKRIRIEKSSGTEVEKGSEAEEINK